MEKKYFCKYLPIEGEIKEGDMAQIHNTTFKVVNLPPKGICKKVKLFLCSKDFQIGDKINYLSRDAERTYTGQLAKIEGDYIYLEEDRMTGYPVSTDSFHMSYEKKDAYKVIGEISPEATWVKEGDEFEEEEILRDIVVKEYDYEAEENEYTHYNPKGNEVFKLAKHEYFVHEYPIKIKCKCCNTFK